MMMTGVFYTFFYVLPLIVIPTFMVDSQKDFLIYSSLFVEPDNHDIQMYTPQLPSSLGVVDENSGVGKRIVGWLYNKSIHNMFVTADLHGVVHTFIKIRPAYILSIGVASRVFTIVDMRKKILK
tara:strand:- start:55 stop:426 length:372 start_codon:yes stop_codon:yes gene_type:complete